LSKIKKVILRLTMEIRPKAQTGPRESQNHFLTNCRCHTKNYRCHRSKAIASSSWTYTPLYFSCLCPDRGSI
jgi:hypothetical protein